MNVARIATSKAASSPCSASESRAKHSIVYRLSMSSCALHTERTCDRSLTPTARSHEAAASSPDRGHIFGIPVVRSYFWDPRRPLQSCAACCRGFYIGNLAVHGTHAVPSEIVARTRTPSFSPNARVRGRRS